MKIMVDLPESELEEICFFTGEAEKELALQTMVRDALVLKRREKIAQKFIVGEWGVELAGFEEGQAVDREAMEKGNQSWQA